MSGALSGEPAAAASFLALLNKVCEAPHLACHLVIRLAGRLERLDDFIGPLHGQASLEFPPAGWRVVAELTLQRFLGLLVVAELAPPSVKAPLRLDVEQRCCDLLVRVSALIPEPVVMRSIECAY
jgi:hypothetical protein